MLKELPFDINKFQVDDGSVFIGNFEQAYKDNNIKLLVLSLNYLAKNLLSLHQSY